MRNAFADEITQIASEDSRIVLLSGDIGNKLFDEFKKVAEQRFLNCGIAEANIIGMAAGMALQGMRPVVYTITPFITFRCFEQIKIDLCYHNLPVMIVGVGSGLSYASLGVTHQSCEDIACMRSLPHMKVVVPADPYEVRAAVRAGFDQDNPIYLRMGKKGEPNIHKEPPSFKLGRGISVAEGTDICLLACGVMVFESLTLASKFSELGVSCKVVSFHTIKPLDEELLEEVFKEFPLVVTIEEHSLIGGLGGAVAEWLVDSKSSTSSLLRIGTKDTYIHLAGEVEFLREKLGISTEDNFRRIQDRFKEISR